MTRIVEILDEREPLADSALSLIAASFEPPDRQPVSELRSEIAEKRLGLLSSMDFHLFAAVASPDEAVGTVAGMYLEGVNAGFITYLAVEPAYRRRRVADRLRTTLVDRFRLDAREAGFDDLSWVLGEVESDSPWIRRLMQTGKALVFDLAYFHPGMVPGGDGPAFVLYRQPVADHRERLPVTIVRRILYAIYRRGYRVRYPLERAGFVAMLRGLEGRDEVGVPASLPPADRRGGLG